MQQVSNRKLEPRRILVLRYKTFVSRFVIAFVAICTTVVVHAQLNRFDGNWVNVDENTRGLTAIRIETDGEIVKVRAFGRCHPMDCDWGWVDALAYTSDGVGADVAETASAVVATYQRGISTTRLIMKFSSPTELSVDTFTKFTDGSDRSNITYSDTMRADS